MRMLWKLVKVAIALALVIPVSIIVLATALGVLGGLLGLAFLALKLAVVGLVAWGVFRLASGLVCGRARPPQRDKVKELPAVDPYYEAAMKELNRELGEVPR
jgi:hypothetical protein